MEVLRGDELRAADLNSVFWGVSTRLLMENAGAEVARVVKGLIKDVGGSVVIIAGVGGKAGDSFVAARHLASEGYEVQVYLISRNIRHEDAKANLEVLSDQGDIVIRDYEAGAVFEADVIIDGLLGIGVKGPPKDIYAEAIKTINTSRGVKVAIDVPSGLDPDTGATPGEVVKADVTVTLVTLKPGLLKAPQVVGKLLVANIGMPPNALKAVGPGDVEVWFRKKDVKAKKGDGGKVLVVTGSREYVGAPWLTAMGAWAAGADLVYLAAPEYVLKTRFSPEIIGVPLTGDYLTQDTVSGLTDLIKRVDVVATGPGLTVRDETRGFLKDLLRIVRESGKALVLDADALKMVKEGELNGMTAVMTPHLGEAAKLLETDIEDMKTFKDTVKGRITVAREIVDRYKATLILKGYVDVVMSPDGRMKTRVGVGHQDMSCGGTGDVLTGITATSLARTGDAFRAASAAAFINAVAGELAYLTDGRSSPTNILKYVPQVVRNPLKTALKVKELRSSV